MSQPQNPPPGWYMDPSGSNNVRWWDGGQWTEHVGAPPPQQAQPQGQSFDQTVNQTADSVAKAFQNNKESGVVTLPAPYGTAFDATVAALPTVSMSVKQVDPANGTIVASTGLSLTSWGEDITIRLGGDEGGQTTSLWMDSKMKFGLVNWGKHEKNFQAIVDAVHRQLGGAPAPPPGGPAGEAPPA